MEDDWDNIRNEKVVPVIASNKWEGEDDDDDVKESWEDEEEKRDEEKVESTKVSSPAKTKSKLLKNKHAAKEEGEEISDMSTEDKLAEKLRLLKVQQESDLNLALETFAVNSAGIDNLNPQSKEEFKEFGDKITSKISQYKESLQFPQFVEDLIRNICVNLSAADIKKVKMSVETLHSEKLKMEKQSKKPVSKGKLKISLRTDDIEGFRNYEDDYDEGDDFM